MAERTRKTTIASVKKTTPKRVVKPRVSKKAEESKPIVNYFNVARGKINSFSNRLASLTQIQKLGILAVIILILLGVYFKNLFVVALVNGQPLTRIQVINRLERDGGQKAMDDLVTKTLIMQEAKKHNVSVSQKEVDDQMKKYEDSVTSQGANFDEALASQGLTREGLRDNVLINKLLEKLIQNDINVTDKDIDSYLEQNKDTLPKDASPEALRQDAKDTLTSDQKSQKAQQLVDKLKSEAHINYFIKY